MADHSAENLTVGLFLQPLNGNGSQTLYSVVIKHVCVVKDDRFILITSAINGKAGLILNLSTIFCLCCC